MALPHVPATKAFQIQGLGILGIVSETSALQYLWPKPTLSRMQRFSEAWSARQYQLDRVFGETIRLVPMEAGGYTAGIPDPDRAERQIPAIMTEAPRRMRMVENSVGRDFDRTVVMADTVAGIDQAKLEGQLPKVGDLVVAIDRPDTPSFEITAVESDGLARILLSLVRLP